MSNFTGLKKVCLHKEKKRLIVCDLEFQSMTQVVGEEKARQILSECMHYTWIYDKVLHDSSIRAINTKNGFLVP